MGRNPHPLFLSEYQQTFQTKTAAIEPSIFLKNTICQDIPRAPLQSQAAFLQSSHESAFETLQEPVKVSSGIYQSVLGYADSITAASSAQSEMTGAPNERQTSPDSGAQTAPTTHPAHERLSFECLFSNGLLSSARPFARPFTRPSFERPQLQHALLRKICKNIQESIPSYPRTIFPQVNDKGISRQPTRP